MEKDTYPLKNRQKKARQITLPPADTKRWVKSRKKAVVDAIAHGQLTDEEACARYDLCPEELASWKHMIDRFGPDALRTTHLKEYRQQDVSFHIIDN